MFGKFERTAWLRVVPLAIVLLTGCDNPVGGGETRSGIEIKPDSIVTSLTTSVRVFARWAGSTESIDGVEWELGDTAIAEVRESTVFPRRAGKTTLTARYQGMTDQIDVEVYLDLAYLRLMPVGPVLIEGSTFPMFARAQQEGIGPRSHVWGPGEIVWSSSDSSVVVPDSTGMVTAVGQGEATITVRAGAREDSTHALVLPPVAFRSIAVGDYHACAVTDGPGVCWGGQPSLGQETGPYSCSQYGCEPKASADPIPVLTDSPITRVAAAAGYSHTEHSCAVTEAGTVYCWGSNYGGQLGWPATRGCLGGSIRCGLVPGAVAGLGGPSRAIGTGNAASCALGGAGDIRCWGRDYRGLTGGAQGETPRRLETDIPFAAIALGNFHGCALDAAGAAYCWGDNGSGQLGIGGADQLDHPVPMAAQPGKSFAQISAGAGATCGLSDDGQVTCWGRNDYLLLSGAAAASEAGLRFHSIDLGGVGGACAISLEGRLYCWGKYLDGGPPPAPVPLADSLRWASVSLGGFGICGIAEDGVGYCLEDGEPVRIAGQR